MKKLFFCLLFAAVSMVNAVAQDAPALVTINVEEFEYKPTKTGMALSLLASVSDPKDLWLPDKSMTPQMNEAIAAGVYNIPWVTKGDAESADYKLVGRITKAELSTGNPEHVSVGTRATLIDNKTGKEVAFKFVSGLSITLYEIDNSTSLKTFAAKDLARNMRRFIFEAIPVTGHILQKGVEQVNGKIKDKQCYVDLGEIHGIQKDMVLYVTEDGKYKAELRILDIMGDDLCTCKISKGDSYIEKGLEKGVDMIVTSRPKKIESGL